MQDGADKSLFWPLQVVPSSPRGGLDPRRLRRSSAAAKGAENDAAQMGSLGEKRGVVIQFRGPLRIEERSAERTDRVGEKKKREDAGRPPVRPMIVGNGSIYAGRTRQGAGAIFGPGEATCKASPSSRDAAALISPRAANARRRNTSVRPAFSPSTPRRGVVPPVARPQRSWSAVAAFAYMDCTLALYGLGRRTSCSRADETNRG